jgi:hypothetical protein
VSRVVAGVLMRRREWGDLPVYCVVGGVFEAWSGIAAVDEQLYSNRNEEPLSYMDTPNKDT